MSSSALIDTGFDGHVHTALCNHASGTMEEYVLEAIRKGLHTLCFLEHLEAGITYPQRSWLSEDDFAVYFQEGQILQRKYNDRIRILLGVEAGYNPEAQHLFQESLRVFPWDRIGLSCHFFRIGTEHFNLLSSKQHSRQALAAYGRERVLTGYFNALVEALQVMVRCDVLCHMDAALRHERNTELTAAHLVQVERILDILKEKGTALEINTSGFQLRGTPFPRATIIQRALARGIPLVAGSDAHSPRQVGRSFRHLDAFLQPLAARPESGKGTRQ